MTDLIFASKNEGKVREFREFLTPFGVNVKSLNELENVPAIDENGTSFEENATIKAEVIAKAFNLPVVAEDSGLSVDALNGEPGIRSARYAGGHDDAANNRKLLDNLKDVPKAERTATFYATIVALKPNGKKLVVVGEMPGLILEQEQGEGGFGYDPLFLYEPANKTTAEMTAAEKNEISHRGNALRKFVEQFQNWWED